ncbi:adaptin N terminal region-domain-containing protein [Fimicolochytrium jonesii]|uniref:adaptin N terminal region-domain-containing protein n=1 Tax=Fimicolochytrium jonesii TaxID=1396493 RepID=UPI0022FEF939|nr:adaptin N terminal region-domain-containing protein [Fimicolochytrium jonesii]KAI8822184.1 adaptin N terminal region-domain-containing protein [Fimicolochytrium jonesii]
MLADAGLFYHIDKSTVLQEARAFNETPINARKCRLILTKLAFLFYQSEVFQSKEATETFFSMNRLFSSPDTALRQMMYLLIKELAGIAENSFMVMQSIMRDMNAKSDVIFRANAIRVLPKIVDSTMLQAIERFIKQTIVDKNPSVSSAALVSSMHLFNANKEVVRRWANEVQEAMNNRGSMTQYHAVGLLYQIRQHDRMAVIKLVQNYSRASLRSPLAYCMLIRFACKIMEDEEPGQRSMYELLEGWLRHKHDMVVYEAARAICNLRGATSQELLPAVSALQLMLVNSKPTLRFAAIRTLNKLAMTHPQMVFPCNMDMENLITDTNRSVATFAITTLLKTGTEASVDRLMKQITGFMNEISDEFKVIVIDAIRSLCLKFPSKQSLMLNFLSNVLRDEGGYEYKRAIVEAIFDIVHHIPESKEFALSHLCEFIEDCEFNKLAVRILHLLGTEGPKTPKASKYIRYIYNRVILENATVRAAAVTALARFAVNLPELRERVKVLLTRCLDDNEDEVRDRAIMYLRIIDSDELCRKYVANDTTYSWPSLERNLVHYLNDQAAHTQSFDISTTPIITKEQESAERSRQLTAATEAITPALRSNATPTATSQPSAARGADAFSGDAQAGYAAAMDKVPELANLGPLFKSSTPVQLTEAETEYVVTCVKHIFASHVVFQFNCRNTLNDSILEKLNVQMKIESSDDDNVDALVPEFSIPIPQLIFDIPQTAYVVYRREGGACPTASFSSSLHFFVRDCDPATGEPDDDGQGYEDEYLIEAVDLVVADYVLPTYVSDFRRNWEDMGQDSEVVETYQLTNMANIKAAVTNLIQALGMHPSEGTDNVVDKATTHTLAMGGIFAGGHKVLTRCRMLIGGEGVTVEIAARCKNPEVAQRIVDAVC